MDWVEREWVVFIKCAAGHNQLSRLQIAAAGPDDVICSMLQCCESARCGQFGRVVDLNAELEAFGDTHLVRGLRGWRQCGLGLGGGLDMFGV